MQGRKSDRKVWLRRDADGMIYLIPVEKRHVGTPWTAENQEEIKNHYYEAPGSLLFFFLFRLLVVASNRWVRVAEGGNKGCCLLGTGYREGER